MKRIIEVNIIIVLWLTAIMNQNDLKRSIRAFGDSMQVDTV